jgi:hypothetical protein
MAADHETDEDIMEHLGVMYWQRLNKELCADLTKYRLIYCTNCQSYKSSVLMAYLGIPNDSFGSNTNLKPRP